MCLEEAILTGNLEQVKLILSIEPSAIEAQDAQGVPLSFLGAQAGFLEVVKYIVEYSRASMNDLDQQQRTILHYGASSGNLALVEYLVEKVGMSPTTGDQALITPFEIAHKMGHRAVEAYFEQVCASSYSDMYHNPIRRGMFPDPSIVCVGEDYYMVNSSFIFFPCIPISHSKDLIHWTIIGHAITNPVWANLDHLEGGRGYWAPDISYNKGKFYITATYRMNDTGRVYRHQIVVSASKAEGPYSQPAIINEDGIDPSIFTDDDGKRYMLLNRGARIFELSEDGSKQVSEAELLYYGSQKRAPEGPHLLKKDGWYYLFLAEGGTGPGHRITVARSKKLMGTYEPCPYNPIMRQDNPDAGLQRCGHGKPFMTHNGEWWMVYLCGRMIGDGYCILGRETAMDPITWTEDGWPLVNRLQGPSVLQKKPKLKTHQGTQRLRDTFDQEVLNKDWMFPRPPQPDGVLLKDGQLWIKGSSAPLSSYEARNIVLRRQTDFECRAETAIDLVPMRENQEGGMTCYYDENTWLTFGLKAKKGQGLLLCVTEHIGEITRIDPEVMEVANNVGVIHLRSHTNYLQRLFQYSFDGITYQTLTSLDNVNYLCDEGLSKGKRFTGAMVGMFVYAGPNELSMPFNYFVYETIEKG